MFRNHVFKYKYFRVLETLNLWQNEFKKKKKKKQQQQIKCLRNHHLQAVIISSSLTKSRVGGVLEITVINTSSYSLVLEKRKKR